MAEDSGSTKTSTTNTEAMRKLLAAVWEKNLPVLRERVGHLESTAALAKAGVLDVVQREAAIATAHKLSGSLGMFGYDEGTKYARSIEQQLEADGPVNVSQLEHDTAALRAALPL